MAIAQQAEATAREGADSVFRYVERTAEPVADGVRWRTLNFHNETHYDANAMTGVAGIVLFLADYARLTGSARALDLAVGGARWSSSPERAVLPDEEWCRYGISRGETGRGFAWLRLSLASGDRQHLAEAAATGRRLLEKGPGPYTDWLDGAAGEGLFLQRLAEATGDERFLEGAGRWAAWLSEVAIRDAHGLYWPWDANETEADAWHGLSFLPGAAGNAYFLACLYQRTGDARSAAVVHEAAATLRRQAVEDHGGLNWPDTLNGLERGEDLRCQWCYGAPGVGLFFAKAHEALGQDGQGAGYLAVAEAAGEATFEYGDVRRNAVQCHGMAGNAELFLELHRLTGQARWLERAHDFARRMFAYRSVTPEGDTWQADDEGFFSPDFMFGAAGTGHFFLRLWQPDRITRPLL